MSGNAYSHTGRVLVASVGVFLTVLILLFAVTGSILPNIGAPFLMATFSYLVLNNKDGGRNILHPMNYFLLKGGVVAFAIPAVLVSIRPDSIGSLLAPKEHLPIVSFLIAASFVAFSLGYNSRFGVKIASSVPLLIFTSRRRGSHYFLSALSLYAVGWLSRIVAWGLGLHHMNADLGESVGIVSSILQPLSVFAPLSFFVLLAHKFSRARRNNVSSPFNFFVFVIIGLEILAGIVDGSRTLMIMPLFYTLIVYNYSYRRVGLLSLLIGFLVLMTVLAPLATAYRALYYESIAERGASVGGAVTTLSEVNLGGVTEDLSNQILKAGERMSALLEGALVVYDKVPHKIPYAEGSTFFPSAFVNFIPRLLWPSKPIFIPGREFAQVFWGAAVGEMYAVNIGIGWVGEAYYNFGWFGLGIPLVLGMLFRFFLVRLEVYAACESQWLPRLYFVMFSVPGFGAFHHYPAGIVRGGMFILLYLAILNYSAPKITRSQGARNLVKQNKGKLSGRLGLT
ncbi:hypothetical protein Q6D67_08125 [Haliea sp. E1-2-M8]|uniref:hypothetical protein n=1 Tax=Haliea sp. E1-2-M8 TaxID=3064706 RepID=UPI0027219AFC|nr:hypothetical protein [Haliea sp. E1-2-M8]MDO8861666.1 hypothetical protein [Haliea sp. E1-2-M8]